MREDLTIDIARGAAGSGVEILSGDLSDIGLSTLLQLVQNEGISGWIEVRRRGTIALSQGHVLDAVCGPLVGLEALRELLFHRGGRFSLLRGEPDVPGRIDNVTFAIMDAYRLRDEWIRVSGLVLAPAHEGPWTPLGGPLGQIVAHLDGVRTVAEAVAMTTISTTLLIDGLLDALKLGLLRPLDAPCRPVEADGLDFFELVDRAQSLMRSANYEAAERQLLRALALRPHDRVVQQNHRALLQRRR